MDWLIKFLAENKITLTDEQAKALTAEAEKQVIPLAQYNQKLEELKTATTSISTRDKQLEELKKADPSALQAEITRLQGENKKVVEDYELKRKKDRLDSMLDEKLKAANAVNNTAVKSLLDMSKVSLDGDNIVGVDDQIKALKESQKWAFTQPSVPGGGGNPAPSSENQEKAPLPTGVQVF